MVGLWDCGIVGYCGIVGFELRDSGFMNQKPLNSLTPLPGEGLHAWQILIGRRRAVQLVKCHEYPDAATSKPPQLQQLPQLSFDVLSLAAQLPHREPYIANQKELFSIPAAKRKCSLNLQPSLTIR
jgi:hypothetical protein